MVASTLVKLSVSPIARDNRVKAACLEIGWYLKQLPVTVTQLNGLVIVGLHLLSNCQSHTSWATQVFCPVAVTWSQ